MLNLRSQPFRAVRSPIAPSRLARKPAARIMAFRDQDRQRQLKHVAHEFARWYGRCLVEGTPANVLPMSVEADPYLEVVASQPLRSSTFKGLDSISLKLQQDHTARYGIRTSEGKPNAQAQVVLLAASDTSDTAFCLMELPPVLPTFSAAVMGDGKAGPQSGALPSYVLLKMGILLDDTSCRVQQVEERAQLVSELEGARLGLCEILRRRQQDLPEQALFGAPFPKGRLQPWATAPTAQGSLLPPQVHEGTEEGVQARAMGGLRSFCALSQTSHHEHCDGLQQIINMDSYQLYDAYGVLPLIWKDVSRETAQKAPPSIMSPPVGGAGGSLNAERVLEMLEATKSVYDVQCKLVEAAICDDAAAGFSSWTSHMYNRITGKTWGVKGMEIAIFEPSSGRLTGTYLFRDAVDLEERLLYGASSTAGESKS